MASDKIEIFPVRDRKSQMAFIKLPWKIYRDDPYWVPPLIMDMKNMMNPKKFPFFLHSEAEFFIARKGNETVGRIAALTNNNHNRIHNDNIGFFGFFETIEDYEVAERILDVAVDWVRKKGKDGIRGPENYSQNDTCGLLVDGFNSSPVIMMPHNPPYYQDFLERYGFQKAMDLYAYYMDKETPLPERLIRVTERLKDRGGVTYRNVNMKDFSNEVERIKYIYNNAWSYNWGFVPMTDEEFSHLAKELKPVVDPDLLFIAEVNGEPVGFSLALPDYNQALKKINGRLFPFGLFKLLYYRKKIDGIRVITMGVVKEYQKRGIDSVFYLETYKKGIAKGYRWGEFSWILENNEMMNSALQMLGARVYKTYRLYEMKI